uniref:hypothetical protein n=1 Tax=Corynebacterium parakroppenstedtii TaxID=2828363 RepID=UPI0030EBB2B5
SLKNNFKTATSEAKTKSKPLKSNLQEPQLKSEGVSLGALVQKCEENALLSTNKPKYILREEIYIERYITCISIFQNLWKGRGGSLLIEFQFSS